MTTSTITSPGGFSNALRNTWGWIKKIPPVYPVFFIIFIVLGFLNPVKYQSMNGIMTFLRTAAPLAVLAIGEMLVLATRWFRSFGWSNCHFCCPGKLKTAGK